MLVRALALAGVLIGVALLPGRAEAAPAPIQWCGNDVAQVDRVPDHAAGRQIHVVYAIPADGGDRFATVASQIATDLLAVDEWWRREDPSRTPRFDLFAFPNCPTRLGLLDLSFVRLPGGADRYFSHETRLGEVASDLALPPFGFADPHKKYLVYYDGPVDEPSICGESVGAFPRTGGALSYAAVWLGACPPVDVGTGRFQALVAVHELIHNLGALPTASPGPPHPCPGDAGHPCDDPGDVLYPSATADATIDTVRLDIGRDDYYDHQGSWWDVRDSDWLSHLDAPQFVLGVTVRGTGEPGRVRSGLPGVLCPPACSTSWDAGTPVELRAEPSAGRLEFAGWSGACTGRGPCTVTMDAARAVVADYRLPIRRLTIAVRGKGRVTSAPAGISCTRSCSATFGTGTTVRLRATPAKGWRFSGWRGGGCAGKVPRCGVPLFSDATATATFTKVARQRR